MIYFLIKIIITAILIVLISETGKKFSGFAAILASLPLTSILAMVWLYIDEKDVDKVSKLSCSILWMVIPSLLFFIALPVFLRLKIYFGLSLFLSCIVTSMFYFIFIFALNKLGVTI